MKTSRFEVLSPAEVQAIDAASLEVLANHGVKVDYAVARRIFARAGAEVDEERKVVRLPEALVRQAVWRAPSQFELYGAAALGEKAFKVQVGGGQPVFAALGTPTAILDLETGEHRPTTLADLVNHIKLIDGCEHIHCTQMDVWPNDIPMTTIHSEAISAWAHHSRKSFGHGLLRLPPDAGHDAHDGDRRRRQGRTAAAAALLRHLFDGQPAADDPDPGGGDDDLRRVWPAGDDVAGRDRRDHRTGHPGRVADPGECQHPGSHHPGADLPPWHAGALRHSLDHRQPAQRHGGPGRGGDRPDHRASAQLARYYGLPIRTVGGDHRSQDRGPAGRFERMSTLLPAVLAGVDYITCAGTLDSSMLERDALLVMDDELAGMALRVKRGIEVNQETLAMDVIRKVGFSGNYITEKHTLQNFRKEHFFPSSWSRQPYESWEKDGKSAMDNARAKPRRSWPTTSRGRSTRRSKRNWRPTASMVAERPLDEFLRMSGELPEHPAGVSAGSQYEK